MASPTHRPWREVIAEPQTLRLVSTKPHINPLTCAAARCINIQVHWLGPYRSLVAPPSCLVPTLPSYVVWSSQCLLCRSASFHFGPTRQVVLPRQETTTGACPPLASPFALRRELLPTSPNFLDDTSAPPLTAARPSYYAFRLIFTPAAVLLQVSTPTGTDHTHRSEPNMSSVRPSPRPPLPLQPAMPQRRRHASIGP